MPSTKDRLRNSARQKLLTHSGLSRFRTWTRGLGGEPPISEKKRGKQRMPASDDESSHESGPSSSRFANDSEGSTRSDPGPPPVAATAASVDSSPRLSQGRSLYRKLSSMLALESASKWKIAPGPSYTPPRLTPQADGRQYQPRDESAPFVRAIPWPCSVPDPEARIRKPRSGGGGGSSRSVPFCPIETGNSARTAFGRCDACINPHGYNCEQLARHRRSLGSTKSEDTATGRFLASAADRTGSVCSQTESSESEGTRCRSGAGSADNK